MPQPLLTEVDMEDLLRGICFKTGPPRRVGVELEWLVHDLRDPRIPLSETRIGQAHAAVRALPLAAALTFEPGGQLELSSLPATSLTECIASVSADLAARTCSLCAIRTVYSPASARIPGTPRAGCCTNLVTTRWRSVWTGAVVPGAP